MFMTSPFLKSEVVSMVRTPWGSDSPFENTAHRWLVMGGVEGTESAVLVCCFFE